MLRAQLVLPLLCLTTDQIKRKHAVQCSTVQYSVTNRAFGPQEAPELGPAAGTGA